MKLRINERWVTLAEDLDPQTPLLWVIRDELKLTATKYGCGQGLCGACTVQVNGQAMRSCLTEVAQVADQSITTLEGLDSPLKEQWIELQVPQCGFCQSGQIMAADALIKQTPKANRDQIRTHMSGNLCRCGTYPRIEAAILAVTEGGNETS